MFVFVRGVGGFNEDFEVRARVLIPRRIPCWGILTSEAGGV